MAVGGGSIGGSDAAKAAVTEPGNARTHHLSRSHPVLRGRHSGRAGDAPDRARRDDGSRQVHHRAAARGAAASAVSRRRYRDRGGGRHVDTGDFRSPWRAAFQGRRGAGDRAAVGERSGGARHRRRLVHARGNPPPRQRQGDLDLAQGGRRHHHAPRQAPGRPSAAADRRPRRHRRPADRRARAGLSACRSHHRLARRAARENRRGVHRSPACKTLRPGCAVGGRGRNHGGLTMIAPLKHSDAITVDVALGARAYDIVIGRDVLGSLGARVAALRPGVRTAIVTDRNVAKHWLEKTEASLAQAGIATSRIVVEEGEGSKTYAGLERVSEALIAAKIERNDLVIALGGGVVGDLAGFAAAILRRGVDFVQVPTSLLAQVDSSVGGKTGINSPQGKNLLGAFHQPVLVIADTSVLDTLSPRQFRSGYAEVAKYGVLGDEAFFAWLETNHSGILSGSAAREHAIATSCRAKAAIVSRDERETGERALLNL